MEQFESIVNAPGASYFDVATAWEHVGERVLDTIGARNRAYDRGQAYIKFKAGAGRKACWVVVKLEPSDEYSVEFHKVDLRTTKTVRGETVMNEGFGVVKILALHKRIPLENLREIILGHFA